MSDNGIERCPGFEQLEKDGHCMMINARCDEIYEYALLFIVKGSLSHRIQLLGNEVPEGTLNRPQFELRRIAEKQMQQWWDVGENGMKGRHGQKALSSTCPKVTPASSNMP